MIGFVKTKEKDNQLIRLLSLFAYAKQIPFCHFWYKDLIPCMEGKKLTATRWNGKSFETFLTDLPPIIDKSTIAGEPPEDAEKSEPQRIWLAEHAKVLRQYSLPKSQLPIALLANGLGQYTIPTYEINSFEELVHYASFCSTSIIKPSNGKKGMLVYKITRDSDGTLHAENRTEHFTMNEVSFSEILAKMDEQFESKCLLQPFLDFCDEDGRAVDFRLFRHRGADGSWKEVASFARVGSNGITANITQGGSIIDLPRAMHFMFPEHADVLEREILMLGAQVPLIVQKYCGEGAFCIGLDVAVDRKTFHPYIIEANVTPGQSYIIHQFADTRTDYYQYLLSGLSDKKTK